MNEKRCVNFVLFRVLGFSGAFSVVLHLAFPVFRSVIPASSRDVCWGWHGRSFWHGGWPGIDSGSPLRSPGMTRCGWLSPGMTRCSWLSPEMAQCGERKVVGPPLPSSQPTPPVIPAHPSRHPGLEPGSMLGMARAFFLVWCVVQHRFRVYAALARNDADLGCSSPMTLL